jgi:nucleotide-binding universal stress UspA family protein
MLKNILVYVDNDDACAARVLSAANMSKHYGAHLTGLYNMRNMTVPAYPVEYVSSAMYESLDAVAMEQKAAAQVVFEAACSKADLSGEFHAVEGVVADNLCEQSRYRDLLVLPQQDDEQNLNNSFSLGDVLLGSAAPCLVLPNNPVSPMPPERAMLGWDGSREAAVALRAAFPLLAAVEKIDVVSVSSGDAEAIDISWHLKRHGFETELHLVDGSKRGTGAALLDTAALLNSDLLIVGAYGHSRLRELVLGGATRQILQNAQLPVLFSH